MSGSRYFLKLAYDGTAYHGWQSQKNSDTIQEVLNHSLSMIFREKVELTGAGRTDAGVHASEYFAHFDLDKEITPAAGKRSVFKLNRFLPKDIVIYDIIPVKPDAHARFSAISRTYHYVISTFKNPFLREFSHHQYGRLDIDLMNEGAAILLLTEDFTSFSKADTDTKTNLCRVFSAEWTLSGYELVFTIRANRFLRNMVRAIVGTLLELGQGKILLEDFQRIIESRNRSEAGGSVPARGLFLVAIEYPEEIFL